MLLSFVGVTAGPATKAHADPACMTNGGVYVVFVRGSGESIDDVRARSFKTSVLSLLANYEVPRSWVELGNLAGSTPSGQNPIESTAYKAVGWADWGIFDGMQGYNASVSTGVTELALHLTDRAQKCPHESIVVGGYSQGAEVAGKAMMWLSNYTLSHIGYVALYGDPRSNSCDAERRIWGRGDANCARGVLGMREPYTLSPLVGRLGSWCDSRDGVCTGSYKYLPVPGNSLSTHGSAYQDRWISNSALEVTNKALSKLSELSSIHVSGSDYTITPPDTSPDSPAAVPPPPKIKSLKRTKDTDNTNQVYAATNSAVTEGWWKPNGDGVHTKEVIHIAQDNIVGFDKTNLPEGKQAVYTAVPDGIWETWWDPQHDPQSAKIITGLTGVRQVIADNRWEGTNHDQYVHRLYVLAAEGPYEFWWKDGGDGIHKNLLDSITGGVTMTSSTAPDGSYELYVATPTWSYELKWNPGQDFHHRNMINITQGDINSLSDVTVGSEERLFTGTSTGVWQGKWVGDGSPANNPEVNGKVGVISSQAMYTGNAFQIYLLTASGVTEFWYTPTNAGNGVVTNRSQGDLTSFTKFNDGAAQQVYTGTVNGQVLETYWGGGASLTTKPLFTVGR